jgi:hypothetical protein
VYQHGQPAGLGQQPGHVDPWHPVQAEQRADRLGAEQARFDGVAHGLHFGLGERGLQHAQPPRLFGLPAQHEQQRPVGQPAYQVGEQAQRGAVRPVHVLHHHDPGRAALGALAGRRPQGVGDGGVQPGHGDRAVQRRRNPRVRVGVGRGQGRDQPPGHRGGLRREGVQQAGPDRQCGPQQVGGQHERQPGLAVVTADGQDGGARLGRFGAQFGDEPGLAAARLSGDGHNAAATAPRLPPRRAQGGKLGRPPHQRPAERRRLISLSAGRRLSQVGRLRRGHGRRRGRAQPPRAHVVVEPRGLRQRPDGQLPVQHPHQRPVLPHGRRTLSGPPVQPDDRLVGGLVQGVQLQPAPGVPGGPLQRALRDARRDQPLQPAGQRLPELLAHRGLPLLEFGAVPQGEPGQEVVPVQRGRPLQRRGVRPADQGVELAHVDPDRGRVERDRRPADDHPVAHHGGRHRQRAPQRGPALGAVRLGP